MSEKIFEKDGELPDINKFWGGKDRGKCIQLTKHEPQTKDPTSYITIPVDCIDDLINRLENTKKIIKGNEKEKRTKSLIHVDKKAINITVDADAGKDSYHIIVGSRGYKTKIFRNGEELKDVENLHLDIHADDVPRLSLTRFTIKEDKK
jgi:hypothetical protein